MHPELRDRFWENYGLSDLTEEEWEALCDGCAQCCRIKFEDVDTGQLASTPLVCELLDTKTRRCTHYPDRHTLVPDCVEFNDKNINELNWLPDTCAYRLVAESKPLKDWHPLISGNRESVREAGIGVTEDFISMANVKMEDVSDHLLKWVENPKNEP